MKARLSRFFYFTLAVLISLIVAVLILNFARARGGVVGNAAGTIEHLAGLSG